MNVRFQTRARRLLLAAMAVLAALACVQDRGRPDVPPQGWWHERGPVVPHDTFPADCSLCHTGEGWLELKEDFHFDHLAMTGTPLIGAHAGAECLRCHNDRGPVRAFSARGCVGCHEDVHRGQLGHDCQVCHTQDDWRLREEIRLHDRTRFPLFGAHAATPCYRCHVGAEVGNFSRAPTDCLSCHREDLARAREPDHRAMGFVDRCDRCHLPTTWSGAGFDHRFPRTGDHAVDCSSCHLNPGDFTSFSCTHCHDHSEREMDDEHDDVSGYVWVSSACLSCHPDGRE